MEKTYTIAIPAAVLVEVTAGSAANAIDAAARLSSHVRRLESTTLLLHGIGDHDALRPRLQLVDGEPMVTDWCLTADRSWFREWHASGELPDLPLTDGLTWTPGAWYVTRMDAPAGTSIQDALQFGEPRIVAGPFGGQGEAKRYAASMNAGAAR